MTADIRIEGATVTREPTQDEKDGRRERRRVQQHERHKRTYTPHPRAGRKMSMGYVLLLAPGHPAASADGYVQEHRLVVERALGKFLPKRHPVHHVDLVRSNNENSNLVACEDQAYHALLHVRADALAACGNPDALRCRRCGGYEHQEDIAIHGGIRARASHRRCDAEYQATRRRRKLAQESAS